MGRRAVARSAGRPRRLGAPAFEAWRSGVLAALDGLPGTRRPRVWLAAICLLLYLPGLASIQPLDLGEARIAVVTRAMLDSGDPLRAPAVPSIGAGGPIAVHWVQAGTVRALEAVGLARRAGIAAYRVSATLGAVLAVLAAFHWGQALVGRHAAFLGAAMLAGCAAVVAAAHLATGETAALAAGTACMGLLGSAYLRGPAGFAAPRALGFWLCAAAAALVQGPAVLLIPALAAAGLCAADREASWLRRLRPAWGVPLLAALALPWWAGAAALATDPASAGHGPVRLDDLGDFFVPGAHSWAFAATAFPMAWIALLALPDAWRGRTRPAPRFLLAWAAAAWAACEAGAFPLDAAAALPPLALLGARWALDPLRYAPPRWLRAAAAALLASVAAAIGLGALAVAYIDLREVPYGLLATASAGLLVWRLWSHAGSAAWPRAALLGTILAAPLYAAVLDGTFTHLLVGRTAARVAGTAQRLAPGLPPDGFGVAGFRGASLLFACGPDVRLLHDGAEAARFLAGAPGRLVAVSDKDERGFHAAAAALDLTIRDEAQIMVFDYLRPGFAAVLFFRVEAAKSG